MGNSSSTAGLSKAELDRMERRLKRLARGERELAQSDLQMVPELAGNPFLPRLFQLHDSNGDGYMDAPDLLALLEGLTRLVDEDARHDFAFGIFDADADGYVTRGDMLAVLLATNRRGLSSSQLAQIVQATVAAFDADGDGRLCAAEFRAMVSCAAIRAGDQGF